MRSSPLLAMWMSSNFCSAPPDLIKLLSNPAEFALWRRMCRRKSDKASRSAKLIWKCRDSFRMSGADAWSDNSGLQSMWKDEKRAEMWNSPTFRNYLFRRVNFKSQAHSLQRLLFRNHFPLFPSSLMFLSSLSSAPSRFPQIKVNDSLSITIFCTTHTNFLSEASKYQFLCHPSKCTCQVTSRQPVVRRTKRGQWRRNHNRKRESAQKCFTGS